MVDKPNFTFLKNSLENIINSLFKLLCYSSFDFNKSIIEIGEYIFIRSSNVYNWPLKLLNRKTNWPSQLSRANQSKNDIFIVVTN